MVPCTAQRRHYCHAICGRRTTRWPSLVAPSIAEVARAWGELRVAPTSPLDSDPPWGGLAMKAGRSTQNVCGLGSRVATWSDHSTPEPHTCSPPKPSPQAHGPFRFHPAFVVRQTAARAQLGRLPRTIDPLQPPTEIKVWRLERVRARHLLVCSPPPGTPTSLH